jgi:hypothetical protein
MKIRHLATIMASVLIGLSSCDDTTESIGLSLTDKVDHLSISSSVFEATTRSVAVNSVISRSSKGYLGRIKDPETGALITGDFMTQFHCMEGYHLTSLDSIVSKDDAGRIIADSCELRLFYTSYYGDSLASMKLTLYELDHPMLENQTYYSDFSPLEQGYVREDGLQKSKAYTLVNTAEYKNKQKEDDYVNNICIRLNEPYTSKSGETYNNYGTYVLRTFYDHPEYFANSFTFTKNVIPGFFLKMTGGLGSMAYITAPQLNIYYRMYVKSDSISDRLTLFSGTEEVLQTTTVNNDAATIDQLVNDNSCTYIKSPSGIFTEVTIPIDDIIKGHEKDTINTAKIVFNRINNEQASVYTLPTPTTLLMVETDSVASFFEKGKLANNKQTYLSTYSAASNNYSFNNIGSLILAMHHAREAGKRTDPEWESHHPNWNKVMLVPVTTNYTTYNYSTLLTEVANNMALTSTRLVGGSTPVQINVIYSKFE